MKSKFFASWLALAVLSCCFHALAQLPVDPQTAIQPISPNLIPAGAAPQIAPTPPPPPPGAIPSGILAFDADTKEYTTKPGEMESRFVFNLTNVSSADVTINLVQTSCGCTTAQLPQLPWKLPPGATGQIPVIMNLAGKGGVVFKTVTIHTDKGQKPLLVKATMIPASQQMTALDRERNQLLAKADRQAVFRGDCARCHVETAIGKFGKDLYTASCGVCHDAEHRATMVPDLRRLPNDTSADYWKLMISIGKEGTLMPAFAQTFGGPLSDAQISSLVDYLVANFPAKGTNATAALVRPKI